MVPVVAPEATLAAQRKAASTQVRTIAAYAR